MDFSDPQGVNFRRVKWTEYKIKTIDSLLMPYRLSHLNIKTYTAEQEVIRYLLAHAVLSSTVQSVVDIWKIGNQR